MPKQILKLNQYHGGENNNADPRDILENQLADTRNIMVDNLGKIRVMGEAVTGHAANTNAPGAVVEPGYGLFAFSHDRTGGHLDEGDLSGKHDGSDNAAVLSDSGATFLADALIGAKLSNTTDGSSTTITDNTGTTITGSLSGGTDNDWDYDQSGDDGDAYTITSFPSTGANYIALADTDGDAAIYIYSNQTQGSGWGPTAVIDLGSVADMKPAYYFARGALRVSDGSFANSNKWWGYVKTNPKSRTSSSSDTEQDESNMFVDTWINSDQTFPAPTYGSEGTTPNANEWNQGQDNMASPGTNAGSFAINARLYPRSWYGITGDWDIPETGDGHSKYYIYTSYVYDNGQESKLSRGADDGAYLMNNEIDTGPPFDDRILYFDFRVSNRSALVDKRIKGINIYWNNNEHSPSERYLLAEYDLEKGLRISGETEYELPYRVGSTYLRFTKKIIYKPQVLTYRNMNGYNHYENVDAKFKTAVTANNRVYIGNVEQNGVVYADSIFMSPPGKYDVFPERSKLEVVTADGDEIVKLEEFADRLLEFKKEKMQLINIAQDPFLESSHQHKGVLIPAAVCKTDFGIAWVNRFGCYLYAGEQVIDLLQPQGLKLISTEEWESFTTDNSIIGFLPKKRQLIVLKDCTSTSTGDIFLYDMPTQSWVYGDTVFTDSKDRTNFITDWNGDLLSMHATGEVHKWADTPTTDPVYIKIATKDIDFGSAALKKKVYNVKITYKGDASSLNVWYFINGDNNHADDYYLFKNPDSGSSDPSPLADKNSAADLEFWHVAELKPATSSEANNIHSIQLIMIGNVDPTFEIKDISIIYRMKSTK